MNIGLLYTPVSIYQMTRGALVLFVGALSVVFLRRRLWLYQLSHVNYFRVHLVMRTCSEDCVNPMYLIVDGFLLLLSWLVFLLWATAAP